VAQRELIKTLTAVERTGGFGATIWRKLYDRPFIGTAAHNAALSHTSV